MAVKIRLRRMGSNKKPFFRIVATDMRRSNAGRFLEHLGWYDPKKKKDDFELKVDRVEYWLSKGAQISPTAKDLLKRRQKMGPAVVAAPPPPAAAETAPAPAPQA